MTLFSRNTLSDKLTKLNPLQPVKMSYLNRLCAFWSNGWLVVSMLLELFFLRSFDKNASTHYNLRLLVLVLLNTSDSVKGLKKQSKFCVLWSYERDGNIQNVFIFSFFVKICYENIVIFGGFCNKQYYLKIFCFKTEIGVVGFFFNQIIYTCNSTEDTII